MIKQLPPEIINQIAAGEVVERPASVLKELIENSLDASSNEIRIFLEEAGIKKIQVIDNGLGIEKSDLDKLFIKHSTSKIESIEDLFNIRTFGFRGEALASIASVSEITLQTKYIKDEIGTEIKLQYGKKISTKPSNIIQGTSLCVENLFGNIPARKKFLKTKSTENKQNLDTINKFIISNPEVNFIVKIENIQKKYNKSNLYKRISSIFKIDPKYLIEINYLGYLKVYGFLIHPNLFLKNRNYQYIFINKRGISDNIISKAILDGHHSFIMKGQYPGYVLFIEIDPKEIDVNVHPRKTEVRFKNNSLIYSEIKNIISSTINNNLRKQVHEKLLSLNQDDKSKSKLENTKINLNQKPDNTIKIRSNKEFNSSLYQKAINFSKVILNVTSEIESNLKTNLTINENTLNSFEIDLENATQLLNSYIITSNKNEILIIDQHAASERILYERYLKSIKNKNVISKILFMPLILEMSYDRILILKENNDILNKLGFDYEEFGNESIRIIKVPDFIRINNFEKLLQLLIEDILSNTEITNIYDEIIHKISASLACHSAVRFGDKLTKEEIKKLISELILCENPYNCPHGRPILLDYSSFEIEKKFKRCSI